MLFVNVLLNFYFMMCFGAEYCTMSIHIPTTYAPALLYRVSRISALRMYGYYDVLYYSGRRCVFRKI